MEGIGQTQLNVKDGQRHSTADAYLRPALSRHNLTVETDARVTSLRFDGEQVVGVTLEQDGREHEVDANEEVILATGAIGSPHLLLLSGIGHSAQLQAHDIDVVTHSPGVGRTFRTICWESSPTSRPTPSSSHRRIILHRTSRSTAQTPTAQHLTCISCWPVPSISTQT